MQVWDEVWALAQDQHGAFTSVQGEAVGADRGWLARQARDGRIGRLFRGSYAVTALVDDWTAMAAAQLVQPRAVAGYTSAAKLQDYDGVDVVRSELLVPPNVRIRGMRVHHVTDLVVPEIVVIDGLRCTDEVRTIIDFAAVATGEQVERAVESLLRRRPEAVQPLRDRAEALARPGKSGPPRVLRVLGRRPATPTESDLETVYWQCLVAHGVPLPTRQWPIGRYRVDLAYPDIKLFIELDGWAFRNSREAFGYDRRRQNQLVAEDWVPLRFTDSDVRTYGRRTAMATDREVRRRRARLVSSTRV